MGRIDAGQLLLGTLLIASLALLDWAVRLVLSLPGLVRTLLLDAALLNRTVWLLLPLPRLLRTLLIVSLSLGTGRTVLLHLSLIDLLGTLRLRALLLLSALLLRRAVLLVVTLS